MASLTPRARAIVLAAAVGVAVLLGGQAVTSRVEVETARTVAVQQAAPLARVCEQDRAAAVRAGADCASAAAVARGEPGPAGPPGRGVAGTTIVDGRLVIAYTDGTVQDVGPVVGGEGRGIRGTAIVAGRLVVEYTDGETVDLGLVVGPAGETGRSIAAVDGSTGRLLVTLSDGTVLDAGPLPAGPAGAPGERGPQGPPGPVVQSYTRTFGDGSAEHCERAGGTDIEPVYDCTRTPPPDDDDDEEGADDAP